MKKILTPFLLLFSTLIFADAVIFSGSDVKALKQNLSLNGIAKVLTTSSAPTGGAGLAAPIGSIALETTTGELYSKTGAGNTAWTKKLAGAVNLASEVTGTLPIANGGTGSATQNFVDLTTDQTIGGNKTFSSTIVGNISGNAATATLASTVTTNANLTGAVTSVGNATSLGSFSSANLSGALTDETGSGAAVFADSPTLSTPNIGAAIATSVNGTTIPSSATLVKTADKISVLSATTSAELAGVISDETGSGALVFGTSPALTTPNIGVATATSVNGTTIPSSKTLETKDTLTTKGDLYVATGATTTVRQAVGADDTVLTADSSATNGVSYRTTKQKGNLLSNWSFEGASVAASWTNTGGGTPATSTTNLQDGAVSVTTTSTGAWTFYQDVTAFASSKSGQEAEASIWVYSATASADLWLCPRVNGASVTASVANGCHQYTNLGSPQKLTVFMLYGSTSTGIEVKGSGAITYILDDAYLGDRRPMAAGPTTTPWTSYTPTSPNSSIGLASTECRYSRVGGDLFLDCTFTASTNSASEARVSLPSGTTTTSFTNLKLVGKANRNNTANAANDFAVYVDPSVSYITFGLLNVSGTAASTKQNASAIFANGDVVRVQAGPIPIAEWASANNAFTTKCDDPRQCETVFSAQISSAGAISNQNTGSGFPWLSSCAITNTSQYTCTFDSSAGFTVTPNCWVQPKTSTAGTLIESWFLDQNSTTSSQVSYTLFESGARQTNNAVVYCQKQGADYTASKLTQQIVQMRGVPVVPGGERVDTFSFSYGTTNATTVCSASPCSYLDQIGSAVTSITRSSAGNYTANLSKTYAKLKCSLVSWIPTVGPGTSMVDTCANCSGTTFNTRNSSTNASADTYGTITCQGQY